jgi:Uma2 family endonuclease
MESTISSPLHDTSTDIFYPDSDGLPMANNTEHLKRITTTQYGLESIFQDRDDVFVAADLFWYPVEGRPNLVQAPDIMIALGRPKHERSSYQQWKEDGIAPQVVFEFLSKSNTQSEIIRKATFFDHYGVQEYYIYDIERKVLSGLIRFQEADEVLEEIPDMTDWKSPRLGIRFDMSSGELQLYKPNGEPFLSFEEYTQLEHLLDSTRISLTETRTELKGTKTELKETRTELDETKTVLNETKTVLDETKTVLDETKTELDETKTVLNDTLQHLTTSNLRAEALAEKLRTLGINPEQL